MKILQMTRDWLATVPVGLLTLFPVAALLAPGPWSLDSELAAESVTKSVDGEDGEGHMAAIRLGEGSGTSLSGTRSVDIALAEPAAEFALELLAGPGSFVKLRVSADGRVFTPLWSAAAPRRGGEPSILRSPVFRLAPPARIVRIRAAPASTATILDFEAKRPRAALHPRSLAAGVLVGLIGLLVLRGREPDSLAARTLLRLRAIDPWVATALVYLALFRLPPPALPALVWMALCAAIVWGTTRAPLTALSGLVVCGIAATTLPRLLENWIVSSIASVHELDVDHRLKPDGDEINADGIRFRGDATSLGEDEFVVAFLGDSFTYGWKIRYEDALPYAFEKSLRRSSCTRPVRAVDMAWPSASPLLSLRLLREIGARYRPDLVVLALDMTDFQDDLRYEHLLRQRGDFEVDRDEIVRNLLARSLPKGAQSLANGMGDLLRAPANQERPTGMDLPDRWFATNAPLETTRADIERGVMRNLKALHRYATEGLDADFAVFVYPRAFQYSKTESPENWEADKYTVLGPYVREPFRYFDEVGSSLPYPVVSLLPHFENATDYPLFWRDDPHWNVTGGWLAAKSIERELKKLELIPCREAGVSRAGR